MVDYFIYKSKHLDFLNWYDRFVKSTRGVFPER